MKAKITCLYPIRWVLAFAIASLRPYTDSLVYIYEHYMQCSSGETSTHVGQVAQSTVVP